MRVDHNNYWDAIEAIGALAKVHPELAKEIKRYPVECVINSIEFRTVFLRIADVDRAIDDLNAAVLAVVPRLPTRGWGPWRQEFYSVCSKHRITHPTCSTCKAGSWPNCWKRALGARIYKRWPRLWRRWANRPAGRRRLAYVLAQIRGDVPPEREKEK